MGIWPRSTADDLLLRSFEIAHSTIGSAHFPLPVWLHALHRTQPITPLKNPTPLWLGCGRFASCIQTACISASNTHTRVVESTAGSRQHPVFFIQLGSSRRASVHRPPQASRNAGALWTVALCSLSRPVFSIAPRRTPRSRKYGRKGASVWVPVRECRFVPSSNILINY